MCLIIAPGADGKKALLPRDVFKFVYSKNDDGFGAMWTEDGQVNHFKTLGLTEDEIYLMMEEYTERFPNVVFHMRYRTHGKVTPGLCHPFRILHRNRHGKDMFFMHNGVLSSWGNDLKPGQSDTTNFKDKMLVPLLTRNTSALEDKDTLDAINRMTAGSRLLFMDGEGKIVRTSTSSWNDRYGLTLSNTYMLPTEQYKNTYTMGTPPPADNDGGGRLYNAYRSIKRDGQIRGYWCSVPKTGLIRTESGQLYVDCGATTPIDHTKYFIPKDKESLALGNWTKTPDTTKPVTDNVIAINRVIEAIDSDDDEETLLLDDDIPFDWRERDDGVYYSVPEGKHQDEDEDGYIIATPITDDSRNVGDAVASQDERLRYARFVHNTHGGRIADREQMVADLMCTGNDELYGLVKADPETASVLLAELFDIFIEQNDILSRDITTEEFAFDPDDMLEHGTIGYHREGMRAITEKRREMYEEMVRQRAAIVEVTAQEVA